MACQVFLCYSNSKHEAETMVNAQDGKETDPPGAQPRPSRWARFIGNIERNFHERKTKKEQENPTDRMARRTANATVAIAIFTIVLAIVGAVTLIEVIGGHRHP